MKIHLFLINHNEYIYLQRYPEYYEHISDAIDLKTIGTKIQNEEYGQLSDLEEDLIKMTKNAMLFNEPGSQGGNSIDFEERGQLPGHF